MRLALVLHAHLPFVRHPEHDDFLEEGWLYEAVAECYLPLLDVMHRLHAEGVPFALTFTLTPTLCAMLRDPLLRSRTRRRLDQLADLGEREKGRAMSEGERAAAEFHAAHAAALREQYVHRWKGDLVGAFRSFQDSGHVEIITCGATHGFLPLLAAEPVAVRAQIRLAVADYQAHFGRAPRGIWLPECAYFPGLEEELAAANLRWFLLDAHGLLLARPRPRAAIYAPVFTPAGPAAFGRDREASRQVWSAEVGYPGDGRYRDFYRDLGWDRSAEELAPLVPPGAPRRFTGFKYHRVTGRGVPIGEKDWYDRGAALRAAREHAGDFLATRVAQLAPLAAALGRDPVLTVPFDAELFGHWWFEGPDFLEAFLRLAAEREPGLRLVTPGGHLAEHPTQQVARPSASSWGQHGYWDMWLGPHSDWIYPRLHSAARRLGELARRHAAGTDTLMDRALRQLARELLLAQSSDWAFLMKTGTAAEYAAARSRAHLARFERLWEGAARGAPDSPALADAEWRDTIFPDLDWRVFAS